jgi:hypothetical protein
MFYIDHDIPLGFRNLVQELLSTYVLGSMQV